MTQPPKKDQHPWLKSYPADIDWHADLPAGTMVEMFDESVRRYGDRICMNFMGRKYTYNQIGAMADKFAKALQQDGVVKGTRVGLCLPNTPFYLVAYYGALKAGATLVNLNPLYPDNEIAHHIKDSGAEIMVTVNVPHVQPKIEKQLGTTPLRKIISCDMAEALPKTKSVAYRAINAVKRLCRRKDATLVRKNDKHHATFTAMMANDGKFKPVDIAPEDIAILQYTGGTTGTPKGAALTHRNLSANIMQANLWFTDGENKPDRESVLCVLPFFHVFSMTVQLNLSISRGSELLITNPAKFDLKNTLESIQKHKPTMFAGVPMLYKAIIDSPMAKKYDLSSLKICLSGGAAMNETVMQGFKKLTGIDIVEGYGLSETSPLAVANPLNGRKKINSIGLPVPGTEVRIIEPGFPDRQTPVKVAGEICLRGPQVMKGYWNRPDATAEAIDKDGFFHTGDIGYIDEDGYTFIVDRIKDMIIVNGYNVYSRNVEDALMQHPHISEAVVIGVKDQERGEAPKAFVVTKDGQKIDTGALRDFLKKILPPQAVPRHFDFRAELPKTMIGKPDKKALRAEEDAAHTAKPASAPAKPHRKNNGPTP